MDFFQRLALEFGLPAPIKEHRFARPRRWRFDYAWPDDKIAVEVEGGVWTRGRHTRPAGFMNDMEKYNAAALRRWVVLRYTPKQLEHADTWEEIKSLFAMVNP